uniref:Uncharacterized protein n=1 Tax=Mola mola TaxID=94237 RepID=A0A3Q3XHK3_MOLML
MQKTSYFFPLLFVCLDACVVGTIRLAHLSAILIPQPFVVLWAGGLARALLLTLLTFSFPGSPLWMRSLEGLQSIGVLCFLLPVYTSLLWALGQSVEELWGWHCWERVLQGYVVTVVAWLYWSQYVSSLLLSCGRYESRKATGPSLQRLANYMRPYFVHFAFVFILVIFSSFGEMAIPQYTGRVTEWIMNEDAPDAFTEAVTIMTLMTLASAVCEFMCDIMYNVTMSKVHRSVQADIFEASLKQEISFFDVKKPGELVSYITTSTNTMSEILSQEVSFMMWYTVRLAFLMIFMVKQSWKMSLLTWMALPIMWAITKFTGQVHQSIAKQVHNSMAKANQVATETFSHMKTVKSFANEDGETEKYKLRLDDTYALNKKESIAYATSMWADSMSTLALKVFILYYGGVLVTRGGVSSGDLVSFVLYELQFSSAIGAVMRSYPEVKKAIGASEESFEILDREPVVPPEGHLNPENLEGRIEFKNVKFSYSGKTDENNFLLNLKPNKITAIVGSNCSGKSTCVKLLERFYQPQAGEILLDGQPLQNYKDGYLHDKIAVVSQDCVLFARSIRENIKYGYEGASDEEMHKAAGLASAHEFIMNLPNGYDTDAGQKGGQVSGGQKQRIAIARALIRHPKILILDSATCELDMKNEDQVNQALLNQTKNCTVLLISKNMSMVEKADHIIVLDSGMVKEEGIHEELMKKGGLYVGLLESENKSFHRQDKDNQKVENRGFTELNVLIVD